jgi:hypothetical protein
LTTLAGNVEVHAALFFGLRRAWALSHSVSRSSTRDVAPDWSPAFTRFSVSCVIVRKPERSSRAEGCAACPPGVDCVSAVVSA